MPNFLGFYALDSIGNYDLFAAVVGILCRVYPANFAVPCIICRSAGNYAANAANNF